MTPKKRQSQKVLFSKSSRVTLGGWNHFDLRPERPDNRARHSKVSITRSTRSDISEINLNIKNILLFRGFWSGKEWKQTFFSNEPKWNRQDTQKCRYRKTRRVGWAKNAEAFLLEWEVVRNLKNKTMKHWWKFSLAQKTFRPWNVRWPCKKLRKN